jgi:hypothetical protein
LRQNYVLLDNLAQLASSEGNNCAKTVPRGRNEPAAIVRPGKIGDRKIVKVGSNDHGSVRAFGVVHEHAVGCGNSPHTLVLLVHLTALNRDTGSALEQHGAEADNNAGLLATRQSANRLELPVEDIGAK